MGGIVAEESAYRRVVSLLAEGVKQVPSPVYVLCLHRATVNALNVDVFGKTTEYAFGYPLIIIDPDETEGLRLIRA
jgi:hypothetical protein